MRRLLTFVAAALLHVVCHAQSNAGAHVVVEPKPALSILEHVSTIVIPATGKFIAKEKFLANDFEIKIISREFKDWFLAGDGKIEDVVTEHTLGYSSLRKGVKADRIIAELGGEDRVEATLSAIFFLMEKQKRGGDGVLLTDGNVNTFYVRDSIGVLRAVEITWVPASIPPRDIIPGRWLLATIEVEHAGIWPLPGDRVFFPSKAFASSQD